MAKRKIKTQPTPLNLAAQLPTVTHPAPVPIEPVDGLIPPPPPQIMNKLAQQQARNLAWCEEWGRGMPDVEGVEVCAALTYDLIQIMNRALVGSS